MLWYITALQAVTDRWALKKYVLNDKSSLDRVGPLDVGCVNPGSPEPSSGLGLYWTRHKYLVNNWTNEWITSKQCISECFPRLVLRGREQGLLHLPRDVCHAPVSVTCKGRNFSAANPTRATTASQKWSTPCGGFHSVPPCPSPFCTIPIMPSFSLSSLRSLTHSSLRRPNPWSNSYYLTASIGGSQSLRQGYLNYEFQPIDKSDKQFNEANKLFVFFLMKKDRIG